MNNIYVLILIILLLIYLFSIKQENFSQSQCALVTAPDAKTYSDCVSECKKISGCDNVVECQKLCLECDGVKAEGKIWNDKKKKEKCPWLENMNLTDKQIPDPPKIRVLAGNRKVLIEWVSPYNGNSTITDYIIVLSETYNKKNGINIAASKNPKCEICEHEVNDLKPQTYYDVHVVAKNNIGESALSNIETVLTLGKNTDNNIKNIFDEESSIENIFSDPSSSYSCNVKNKKLENHSLDSKTLNDLNLKNFIESLK